jgi:hypothetical protein
VHVTTICPGFVRTDDEDRAPRPDPCLDRPVGSHLSRRIRAIPDHLTHDQQESKDAMKSQKSVIVDKPLDAVFNYLSDFTTTTGWDPGTVVTVNQNGDGAVGTTYLNTSAFLGRKTQLTYIVGEFIPGKRIRLRGTLIAVEHHDLS